MGFAALYPSSGPTAKERLPQPHDTQVGHRVDGAHGDAVPIIGGGFISLLMINQSVMPCPRAPDSSETVYGFVPATHLFSPPKAGEPPVPGGLHFGDNSPARRVDPGSVTKSGFRRRRSPHMYNTNAASFH